MRLRPLLAAALLAAAMPLGTARATHCDKPAIYLFTSVGAPGAPGAPVLVSSAIGCVVLGMEEPNTDWIYPGSNYWQVRWLLNTKPTSGTIKFAGQTIMLEFAPGKVLGVVDAAYFDSQWFSVDPTMTIMGGKADITVCADTPCEGENLFQRTYLTMA